MPNKCSAPKRRSNYAVGPPKPVSKMPGCPPEIVTQWKAIISCENIEDINMINICLKHFRKELETHFFIPQQDVTTFDVNLSIPRIHQLQFRDFQTELSI